MQIPDEWQVALGDPYPSGAGGRVWRGALPDGAAVVTKLATPHREAEHEAAALELWNGDGAVRLLAHDPARNALLLERCEPGTPLSLVEPDQALDVLVGLLPRLSKPAGQPFRTLADEAVHWIDSMRAWRDRSLADIATRLLAELVPTQGEQVLLHQDLHGDNVLAAQREPWLVIDPKPLVGEREFALAPIVRSPELGHSRRAVLNRLDRLTAALDLERERARGWTIAQTIAWSAGDDYVAEHVEAVHWLLEAR
jgi:streptomycin 6-kinase